MPVFSSTSFTDMTKSDNGRSVGRATGDDSPEYNDGRGNRGATGVGQSAGAGSEWVAKKNYRFKNKLKGIAIC